MQHMSRFYVDGRLTGEEIHFDNEGRKRFAVTWKDDVKISEEEEWDETGAKIAPNNPAPAANNSPSLLRYLKRLGGLD